ncbi:Uncharacterised protein [Enterobacter cloacae]|nr:Uncharacterised protein [Enterobacter cloacae]
MVTYQRPLSGLGFGKRQPQRLDKFAKRFMRAGIAHAAAANHQRTALAGDQRPRLLQALRIWRAALDVVHATREEAQRVVPGFSLHVLRQANGHRAGIGGVSERSHRA